MHTTNKRNVMEYLCGIAVLIVLILFTNNPIMDKLDEYCKDYDDGV